MNGDGYFYTYVANHSEEKVYYNNLIIQRQRGQIRAANEYYPFGLTWSNPSLDKNEAYQGKEFQMKEWDEAGMELYDFHVQQLLVAAQRRLRDANPDNFGARMYDPVLGRWHCPACPFGNPMDQFDSPYNAMGNNPVMRIDPDGMLSPWVSGAIGAIGNVLSSLTKTVVSFAHHDFTMGSMCYTERITTTTHPFKVLGNGLAALGAAANIAGMIERI